MDAVKKFLKEHWDQKSPLLLGYSGGNDSKALLYSLLEYGILPHLAHVDHGWREESLQEALHLSQEAERLGLPFHTIRLLPDRREVAAREKRLEFFASLQKKIPFQALLLAHHADDEAETTLKRVLEGAHLAHLGGMKPVFAMKELILWRPLLEVNRKEISTYLENKKLESIQDATNFDPAYLRARMRTQIFPHLSALFGKEVAGNLSLLGKRAHELNDYLNRRTNEAFQLVMRGPWGLCLPPCILEPIELRHLLQRMGIFCHRSLLDDLVKALLERQPNRKVGSIMVADRGWFFCLSQPQPRFLEPVSVKEGVFYSGDWRIEIVSSGNDVQSASDWRHVWLGTFSLSVPEGMYQIALPPNLGAFRKMLNEKKVPAFLRPHLPAIYQEGKWAGDFLSGQKIPGNEKYRIHFFYVPTGSSLKK
jgi:tRNA(Ile)-lysidine synthase